jgi:hypothetical protein
VPSRFSALLGPLAAGLALASLSAVSAYADINTGFEPPAYSVGLLAGQNGWQVFGPGVVVVESALVYSGTQAVFVDGGSSAVTQSGPYYQTTTGAMTDLSAEIFLASSSTETGWQFASTGSGLFGYAGGVDIYPTSNPLVSNVLAITGSGGGFPTVGAFTRDQWNNVNILLNYTTQTYSIALNGSTLASNISFCGDNSGVCNGANVSNVNADEFFDTFGATPGSDDSGFIDNFSATTATPEPSLYVPAVLGLVGLGWRKWRRPTAGAAPNRSERSEARIQQ